MTWIDYACLIIGISGATLGLASYIQLLSLLAEARDLLNRIKNQKPSQLPNLTDPNP